MIGDRPRPTAFPAGEAAPLSSFRPCAFGFRPCASAPRPVWRGRPRLLRGLLLAPGLLALLLRRRPPVLALLLPHRACVLPPPCGVLLRPCAWLAQLFGAPPPLCAWFLRLCAWLPPRHGEQLRAPCGVRRPHGDVLLLLGAFRLRRACGAPLLRGDAIRPCGVPPESGGRFDC